MTQKNDWKVVVIRDHIGPAVSYTRLMVGPNKWPPDPDWRAYRRIALPLLTAVQPNTDWRSYWREIKARQ